VAIVEVKFKKVVKHDSILNKTDLSTFSYGKQSLEVSPFLRKDLFYFPGANIIDYIFLRNFFVTNF